MSNPSFEDLARTPDGWISVARRLHAAAHTLWQAADFERPPTRDPAYRPRAVPEAVKDGAFVAIGLAGLALENLAKALLICRDPSLVSNSHGLSKRLTKHTLLKLVTATGIQLYPEERAFLFRAEGFVIWSSRYPVPRGPVPPPVEQTMGISDDFEVFDAIYNRLLSALRGA